MSGDEALPTSISDCLYELRNWAELQSFLGLSEFALEDPNLLLPPSQRPKPRRQEPPRQRQRPKFAQEAEQNRKSPRAQRAPSTGPTWNRDEKPFRAPVQALPSRPLSEVHTELNQCTKCSLSQGRNRVCVGGGNLKPRVVVIHLMPSEAMDEQSEQFGGKDGVMLSNMLSKVLGVKPEQAFVTSVVKCRPQPLRGLKMSEVKACRPFLMEQIVALKPKLVIAFGDKVNKALFALAGQNLPAVGQVKHLEKIPVLHTHDLQELLQNQALKRPVLNHLLSAKSWLQSQ